MDMNRRGFLGAGAVMAAEKQENEEKSIVK